MKGRYIAAALALLTATSSCHDALRPKSGGEPFEVLLLAGDDGMRHSLDSTLTLETPGLPQRESLFNVSTSNESTLKQYSRYARCIVIATKDTTLSRAKVRYEKDTYAKPQMIIRLSAPSAKAATSVAPALRQLIERFEMNAGIDNLRKANNTKGSNEIKRMFGWTMLIPKDLTAMKQGDNFLWLSDDGKKTISSICIYTYNATTLDAQQLLRARDSIMERNIPGETPDMHMATERHYTPIAWTWKQNGRQAMGCRGLWQMENDAMGGPFVCHATLDTTAKRVVVAEAFVYAPGTKKRNLLKRLEAALYTLQNNNDK